MNMIQCIRIGAEQAVAADPHPLTQKQRLDRAMADAVKRLGPIPPSPPLPPIPRGPYHDAPCTNPRERYGAIGVNRYCMCGFYMGEHQTNKQENRL